jgi:carbohydrate-selective porin OprB
VDFLNAWGGDSFDDAGDWQWSNNIDGPTFAQIAELWWEQKLLDGFLRLKLGKVEANSEFAYTDNGADFLNSSFGFSPTIFVLPSSPDPATAAIVFLYPTPDLSFGFAVFDGATHAGIPTGDRGPRTFFGEPSDLFFIGEAALRWGADALPGRVSLGGWGHTGEFD